MKKLARDCTAGCAALALALLAGAACAEDFPKKPIRIVIGIAAGGGLDSMTRVGAQKLSERWGQSAIVDNRPGGGTVIAMDMVAQAPPDGYTLLGASETLMLNGVLHRARYDVRQAFIPIVRLAAQSYVMVVTPSLPVKNVKELIAYARAKPGALSYGSQGLGTQGHIGMERFKAVAGVDIVHVPYKGAAPALIDVLSGQIQLIFASTVASAPHIRSGKMKGIAVTGAKRSPAYPDIPTVAESGVSFELTNSYSYYAPARTPMGVVRAVNAVVSQGMNAPETVKLLAADGSEPAPPLTPEEFKAKFAKDYAELERVVKAINLKLN
jgi:tripartite-type tricarboxylate transporter receptor subunit TctC